MENKEKLGNILALLMILIIALLIHAVFKVDDLQKEISEKDKIINDLKVENAILKEENQDIMGLWSDLVIENK